MKSSRTSQTGASAPALLATAVAVALLAATASPLHAQNREHQLMAAEQRIMMERLQLLEIANEKTLAQLSQLAQLLKAVNDRIDASDAAMVKSLADQKVVLDNLNVEMRIVRQNVQETGTRLQSIKEEIESVGSSVSTINLRSASSIDTAAAAPTTDPVAGAVPTSPAGPRSGLPPGRLYDTAWFDYTSGNYPLATSGFERLLSEYPKSDRADDAQYYIGMSYLKQKKLPEAISAFTAVINTYPTGDSVDEAYYYLGDAQRTLGQTEAARLSWQTVVSKYPGSDGALLAKQRLDGLAPPAPSAAPRQP